MSEQSLETIEVRHDERFDESRLVEWIGDRLPGADRSVTVRQFSRGKANLTYLLSFEGAEYVLRRPPLGPVAPSSHDMGREFKVLSALWRVFPQAAQAYLYCEDPDVMGAPFFIMERKHGVVVQGLVPEIFGSGTDRAANRKLSEAVIDTLADLHAVSPEAAGLGDLGRPEGFVCRQVEGWIERWHRAKHEENPLADELASWLLENLPASDQVTLLHNDWRLDNMAVAQDDPGRCVAVYDWDMCTRGDPLVDVGTALAIWFDEGEAPPAFASMPTAAPVDAPGFMTRGEAIERYVATSGRDLAGLEWYLAFGAFKMAVVLQQIYIRYHRGQTQDRRFAVMGVGAQLLFEVAAERRTGVR